jgi:hypothetical protein
MAGGVMTSVSWPSATLKNQKLDFIQIIPLFRTKHIRIVFVKAFIRNKSHFERFFYQK